MAKPDMPNPNDPPTMSFMRLVNHVFISAACHNAPAGTSASIPALVPYARPATADLVLRFVRPLDDHDEKRPFQQALDRLLKHNGLKPLNPLLADDNAFDRACRKGDHQTMTVSLPAAKAGDVERLADRMESASQLLHDEAHPRQVVLRHQLNRIYRGASPPGP